MGQTLTHGVYLPDEGERNCYDGLASNWSILDGAVGTVAEHTTQIAGKAPAVHTHTKSDITDFPVYGTTAGTICEGNDSRLSDARTPVAHTHTKSDVTDLLNSNFIPSANNSYDLGSASYQWKSVYAQSYYYNGTEFQDKFVTLDTVQTISARKNLKDYWHLIAANLKAGAGETYGRTGYSFVYTDRNDVEMGDVTLYKNSQAARTFIRIRGGDYYTNGVPDADGTLVQSSLRIGTKANSTRIIECDTDALYPLTNNATDLGISDNKWKSLNGVNPGALSLPSQIGYVTIDTTNWDLTGNTSNPNFYTPTVDGWLCVIALAGTMTDAWLDVWENSLWGQSVLQSQSGELFCMIPVIANITVRIRVKASSIYDARLFVASGNV